MPHKIVKLLALRQGASKRLDSENTILDLVALIYEAAGNPDLWTKFLGRFAEVVGAQIAVMVIHGAENRVSGFGLDPYYLRKYEQCYEAHDIRFERGEHLMKPGFVHVGQMLCPDDVFLRSAIYNEYYLPQNLCHSLGSTLVKDNGTTVVLTSMRDRGAGAFEEKEQNVLQLLAPHLRRAVSLSQKISYLKAQSNAAIEVLDRFPTAVILIGQKGQILMINQAARTILDRKDGLFAHRDGLYASASAQTAALRHLIAGALPTGTGIGYSAGGVLSLDRPSQRRPLSVLVTPLSPSLDLWGNVPARAAVFINDPEKGSEPTREMLTTLFGFTPAETRVASALMNGRSLEQAAGELALSVQTVRNHLKRIFSKTDTSRQAELTRLLLAGCANFSGERAVRAPAESHPETSW
jgi:DNA-binding CsgD family transcriptional regulator